MGTLDGLTDLNAVKTWRNRSEEHTSELQSQPNLVCRLLLEKKNIKRFGRLPNPQNPLPVLPFLVCLMLVGPRCRSLNDDAVLPILSPMVIIFFDLHVLCSHH